MTSVVVEEITSEWYNVNTTGQIVNRIFLFWGYMILEMTLNTLEYLLSFSFPLCSLDKEGGERRLKGVKFWNEHANSWDVLYLISSKRLQELRQSDPKKSRFLFKTYSFACPEPISDGKILCPQQPVDEVNFFNHIQDCFFSHETWLTEIRDMLFQTNNPWTIFPFCGSFLHFEIKLFDDDYKILASSVTEQRKRATLDEMNELTQEEEYQHVKELHGVFEYISILPNVANLCYNIFVGGVYFARLVALCPVNISLSGPANLMEELGDLLTDFYEQRWAKISRLDANEEFNRVLAMLLTGTQVDHAVGEKVLERRYWNASHSFLAVRFEFQIPVSLDFYCSQIEQQLSGCSAVLLDQCIYCVVNLSASETAERDFWSFLPVFLRESLCKAGISSVCNNFYRLYDCRLEADAALRLGRQRQKDFWYYRFSDYMMDYIVEAATAHLPVDNLCHPAVRKLRQYDGENNSDLTESLRQYLIYNCNASHTAAALFIHRTTMLYRIEKIQQLTGIRLDDPVVRMHLELSFFLIETEA